MFVRIRPSDLVVLSLKARATLELLSYTGRPGDEDNWTTLHLAAKGRRNSAVSFSNLKQSCVSKTVYLVFSADLRFRPPFCLVIPLLASA
jgi:hypothetical protein